MSVQRPTFSESWSLVEALRPSLRPHVQSTRVRCRGETWRVFSEPGSAQHARCSPGAYAFVGLLDGGRTVGEAWRIAQERAGDDAPTQGEAIAILSALYTANLLRPDLPDDAEALLRRRRKRVERETKGRALSLLFLRIPLLDPDRLLDRLAPVLGWLFRPWGVCAWLLVGVIAALHVPGREREFFEGAAGVLAPSNLPLLLLAFVVIKAMHEIGHGVACKAMARAEHAGDPPPDAGAVHEAGLMLLVLTPVPYVDATSAWSLRGKWRRAVVGAAGMYVELLIAFFAMIVWARTGDHSAANALAYNAIVIAGVSTIVFNANPLLRFDGYYILSDLLETPNLAKRSQEQLYALVKRRVWGVRRAQGPAAGAREARWLIAYAITSGVYKVFVFGAIILFVSGRFFVLGVALAALALYGWLVLPGAKFINYLLTSPELERTRPRALATTLGAACALVILIGLVPAPDRPRAHGVVEPARYAEVHAPVEGFVLSRLVTGDRVSPAGDPLVELVNAEHDAELAMLLAQRREHEARRRIALGRDASEAQAAADRLAALDDRITLVRERIGARRIVAPFDGVWIAPDLDAGAPAFVRAGDSLGAVAGDTGRIVRVVIRQQATAALGRGGERVQMRVPGRAEQLLHGTVIDIAPGGRDTLPAAALGIAGGGDTLLDPADQTGLRARQRFFEARIEPDDDAALRLGERVVVRFEAPARPLGAQWLRLLRQTLQRDRAGAAASAGARSVGGAG
ncbi:MAG: hypothetical protein EA379_08590 [Phycisphaerales bacterium]|nr:MAG: hypothetical protein EA379_08590 [Phycisphaerales bacterium]